VEGGRNPNILISQCYFVLSTGRCVQHTDEQRKNVRELLLEDVEEVPYPATMRGEGISQLSSSLDQDDVHVGKRKFVLLISV